MPALTVTHESWPLAKPFAISRGSKTASELVIVEIRGDDVSGRGECVPYARYGETVEGVVAALRALAPDIAAGMDCAALQQALPAGAARNALDCALWDFEAKKPAYRSGGWQGCRNPGRWPPRLRLGSTLQTRWV
jgi:L-alanine-DL-glutamate epimerase-like enolase superfamily enzyme